MVFTLYFVCLSSFDFCQVDDNAKADEDRDPVENLGQVRGREKGRGGGEGRGNLLCLFCRLCSERE